MANQYKNKVVYNGTTLIDLSDTTAVQSDVASGKYFYTASGEKVVGTASGGGMTVTDVVNSTGTGSVISGEASVLGTKTITANGTYSASDDSADGYSSVTVNVPSSGGITPTGTLNITTNGTHDVTNYASASVNVTPNLQSKTATPTTSNQTVSPDNGYDGLSSVTVGAIPSQYIVPTGNKAITENGTDINVAEYATVSVNVPSGVSITDGIVVKSRDSNGYATAVDFYGTVVQPHQFYDRTTSTGGWINLSTISFKSGVVNEIKLNGFTACGNLTTIDLSSVETIENSAFQDCKALSLVTLSELTSLGSQAFMGCTSLQTFVAPKLKNCGNARALRACTALTTVQLGSIGYNVTSIGNAFFEQDTQTGLTITVYTKGSYVDTAVTNVRNGATNATIIVKASEATTYSGTSYAAGDTIVTSTP